MKKLLLLLSLLSTGCSKDEDCTRTEVLSGLYLAGVYYPEEEIEVPCDFPETEPIGIDHDSLKILVERKFIYK